MLYFDPKPNYQRLSRYFSFPGTPDEMFRDNPDGYLIAIDWWQDAEKIRLIESGFQDITQRYGLNENHDDLLLLILTYYKDSDEVIEVLWNEYAIQKRIKELAGLLLFINTTTSTRFAKLAMASPFDSVKLSDSSLIDWIGNLVVENVTKGTFKISLLGYLQDELIFNDVNGDKVLSNEKLKTLVDSPLKSPKSKVRELQADLCFALYRYLKGETQIHNNPDNLFSDALLHFYFDVLELLGYVDRLVIESPPKHFIRAILTNRINILNH